MSTEAPHNLSLEKAVLSCILSGKDAGAMAAVRAHIDHALVFFSRDHRLIWCACEDLDDEAKPVTMEAVADELSNLNFRKALERLGQLEKLHDAHQLDGMSASAKRAFYRVRQEDYTEDLGDSALASVGGFSKLAELTGAYTTSRGLEDNAQRLYGYYVRRNLIKTCDAVKENVFNAKDAAKAYAFATNALEAVAPRMAEDSISDPDELALATIDDDTDDNHGDPGSWGIPKLDEQCPLRRNSMTIVAALPGCGKSSLAIQVARHTAKARDFAPGAVALCSLEVDARQVASWMAAQSAGVSITQATRKDWDSSARERARSAAVNRKGSVSVQDGMTSTVEAIKAFAKDHHRKHGQTFHTLIIDHLHRINESHPGQSEYTKICHITNQLVWLRKELNINILLLAQLNRDNQKSDRREPRMSDLRGSGSIEQDADNIIILSRDERHGVSHINIVKNRYGPPGKLNATYNPSIGGQWSTDATTYKPPSLDQKKIVQASPPTDKEDLFFN